MIYRQVLVDNSITIPVADMDYRKYHNITVHSRRQITRTPYWTLTHDDEELERPTNPNGEWTCQNRTTYHSPSCSCTPGNLVRESSGLLRLSRQIRLETIPIFYGENCFNFCGDWATVPFLQDRTALARESIRHARLFFIMVDDGHHPERQSRWIKNCEYIAEFLPHLESLSLKVMDFEGRLLRIDKSYNNKRMRWILALMKIKDLRKLEVQLEISDAIHYFTSDSSGVWDQIDAAEARLLAILEPKMLRAHGLCTSASRNKGAKVEVKKEELLPTNLDDEAFDDDDETESSSDESMPF